MKHINTSKAILLSSGLLIVFTICVFAMADTELDHRSLSIKAMSKSEIIPDSITAILKRNQCLSCHHEKERLVGPSFQQIAMKDYSASEIGKLIRDPEPSNWPGYPAMPPMQTVSEQEVTMIAKWINSLRE